MGHLKKNLQMLQVDKLISYIYIFYIAWNSPSAS